MARTFINARVSTADQTTDNQLQEIQTAGFTVDQRRIVTEGIFGSMTIASARVRQEKGNLSSGPCTGRLLAWPPLNPLDPVVDGSNEIDRTHATCNFCRLGRLH